MPTHRVSRRCYAPLARSPRLARSLCPVRSFDRNDDDGGNSYMVGLEDCSSRRVLRSQLNFCSYVLEPLFDPLARLLPDCAEKPYEQLQSNIDYYREVIATDGARVRAHARDNGGVAGVDERRGHRGRKWDRSRCGVIGAGLDAFFVPGTNANIKLRDIMSLLQLPATTSTRVHCYD